MLGPKVNFGGRCFRKIEKHLRNHVFSPYSIDRRPIAMMQKNTLHVAKWMHVAKKPQRLLTAHESFLRVNFLKVKNVSR